MKNKKTKAFTLIELLVVIVIIGILATIGIASLRGHFSKARNAAVIDMVSRLAKKIKINAILQGGAASIIGLDGVDYSGIKVLDLLGEDMTKLPTSKICHGAGYGKFFVAGKLQGDEGYFTKGTPQGKSEFEGLSSSKKEDCDLGTLSGYLLSESIIFDAAGNTISNSLASVSVGGNKMTFTVTGPHAYMAWIRVYNSSGGGVKNVQWRKTKGNPWTVNNWNSYYLSSLSSGETYNIKVQMYDYIPDENGTTTLSNGEVVRVEVFEALNQDFTAP